MAIAAAASITLIFGATLYLRAGDKPVADSSPVSPVVEAAAPPVAAATEAADDIAENTELVASTPKKQSGHRTDVIAFYANWGDEGLQSLEDNAEDIDILMPMWYHLGDDLKLTFDDRHAKQVADIIKKNNPDMKIMPIVNNYNKATESWNAPVIGEAIADPATRKAIARHIVATLDKAGYDGVNIDFESFTEKDRTNLVKFMAELYPLAEKAGLEVSMDVIVGSKAYDHKSLSKHVDYMVPMMYDEHWKTSGAGPISGIPWYERTIKKFFEQVPPEKVVIALGTYAYDWGQPGERAKSLSYADATKLARDNGKDIALDASQLNSQFRYRADGKVRSVWILDALSAFNHVSVAAEHEPRGYALWRLGVEDPALWKVLPNRDNLDREVAESLANKKRTVTYDDDSGLITKGRLKK